MHNIEQFFGKAELTVAVPSVAQKPELADVPKLSYLPQRDHAFYDESLCFVLNVKVSDEYSLSEQDVQRLFTSPALEIVAEVGYLEDARSGPVTPSKVSASGVPFTPLPQPDSSKEDASFANAPVSTVWHTTFDASKGLMDIQTAGKGWVGVWVFDAIVSYPAINLATPLLALTCTLTLKLGLDPSLQDIFSLSGETPPSPPVKQPLRTNRKRMSGPGSITSGRGTPPIGYHRSGTPPAGLYDRARSASPALSRTIEQFDPEKEAKRAAAASARRKRAQKEEYAFAGFEDVNLLESVGRALTLKDEESHFPSSRLHPAVTASTIGITSSFRGTDLPVGHVRRHSRAGSTINTPDVWPTLRRSHRKTLKVHSAIYLRIRVLDCPVTLPPAQGEEEANEEGMDRVGTTLSVEIENNQLTRLGFEVDSIWLEVYSSTANATLKRLPSPLGHQTHHSVRLGQIDQQNFLFNLQAADVLEEHKFENDEVLPSTPLSATVNPSQMLSGHFQQKVRSGQHEADEPVVPSRALSRQSPLKKSVCVVVTGRPIVLEAPSSSGGQALSVPDPSRLVPAQPSSPYITSIFESRWNCAVDLSPLAVRRDENRNSAALSARSDLYPSTSMQRANSLPVNSGVQTPIAGNKRFSMSSLSSMSTKRDSFQDVPLGGLGGTATAEPANVNGLKHFSAASPGLTRLQALKEAEGDTPPSSPIETATTPAFPPYSATRQEADFVEPLTASPMASQFALAERSADARTVPRPPNATSNDGGGVLLHVSLAALARDAPEEDTQHARIGLHSEAMVATLSTASAASIVSVAPEATRPLVGVLQPFQIEIFVMNKTDSIKRLQIGIPERLALGSELHATLSGDAADLKGGPAIVPLDNHVGVGPLGPGACQTVRLKFVALSVGHGVVKELQVTDLGTGRETRLRNVLHLIVL